MPHPAIVLKGGLVDDRPTHSHRFDRRAHGVDAVRINLSDVVPLGRKQLQVAMLMQITMMCDELGRLVAPPRAL